MKLTVVVLAVVACASALPTHQVEDVLHKKIQQDVWDILKYINNPIYRKEHVQIAESYSPEANIHLYKDNAYQYFAQIHPETMLKKGEIFSVFDVDHIHQAKALFKLFYYADSYETFFKTALWARHHLNEGLFMYTYSVAIVHRDDTQEVILPPIYEIYPHFFFNSEVIQKAYKLKMSHYNQHEESQQNQAEFTIFSNYSGYYLNLDPEQSLSYYLEDVGINAFYFYFNLYYPYWMNSEEFHVEYQNRGEFFYYLHNQLYARYHLERLSHGVGDVEYFDWDLPFQTGYYPSLTYSTGLTFPERPHMANLKEYLHYYGQRICDKVNNGYGFNYVQTYEQRIKEAIDSGFIADHTGNKHDIYTEEGINVLGNIIEGNADSPNYQYYGSYVNFARHLLGYSKLSLDHHKVAPSALEHYSTSLRDPAFYQMFKKVLLLVNQYKYNLPPYHHKHLYQEGLTVGNVEVDPMITYYDHFYSDISNGLYVTPEEYETNSFRVRVHQYRLNHKNFNYKVHVTSQKEIPVVVKVFLGPKYDEHGRPLQLSQIHKTAYEFDHFVHNLKVGENVIMRNSGDYELFVKDPVSYYKVDKRVMDSMYTNQHQYGFPLRYKLPRGSEEGTTFQMYVIVYPYVPAQHSEVNNHQLAKFVNIDSYPMGYPFDRPTEHEDVYHVPNAYVKNVKIYHKVNKVVNNEENFEKNYEHEVENVKLVHHNNEQKKFHKDVYVYVSRGDHNNYRQYHDQEQKLSHVAHEEHPIHENMKSKINLHALMGKSFRKSSHDDGYRKYYPTIRNKNEDYVPEVYEQVYPEIHYAKYQTPRKHETYNEQFQDVDYQKSYNKHVEIPFKYQGDFEYNLGDAHTVKYTPYQWNHQVTHGDSLSADYQSTDIEHNHKPYQHY